PPEISTLSLHDALPISWIGAGSAWAQEEAAAQAEAATSVSEIVVTGSRIQRKDADSVGPVLTLTAEDIKSSGATSIGDLLQKLRSEEHTSELQSRENLV